MAGKTYQKQGIMNSNSDAYVGQFSSTLRFRKTTLIIGGLEIVLSCVGVAQVLYLFLNIGNRRVNLLGSRTLIVVALLVVCWLVLFWFYVAIRLYYSAKLSRSVTTAISDVIMWRRCSVALLIVYVVIVIDQVRTESNNDENVYYWYDLCLFLRILFLYVVHQYLTELRKITATATSDTYQVPPVTFSGMQTAC